MCLSLVSIQAAQGTWLTIDVLTLPADSPDCSHQMRAAPQQSQILCCSTQLRLLQPFSVGPPPVVAGLSNDCVGAAAFFCNSRPTGLRVKSFAGFPARQAAPVC